MRDPHEVLGVSETASKEEIRRSYRRLVRRHHPDLNPEDPRAEERFKELQKAYELLMDGGRQNVQNSSTRPRGTDSRTTEGFIDFSNFLKDFAYRRRGRSAGETGHLRELSEEDVASLLKRFGIDASRASKIKVSFGDAANFGRRFSDDEREPPRRPPPDDLKRPPKPPKPPKW